MDGRLLCIVPIVIIMQPSHLFSCLSDGVTGRKAIVSSLLFLSREKWSIVKSDGEKCMHAHTYAIKHEKNETSVSSRKCQGKQQVKPHSSSEKPGVVTNRWYIPNGHTCCSFYPLLRLSAHFRQLDWNRLQKSILRIIYHNYLFFYPAIST